RPDTGPSVCQKQASDKRDCQARAFPHQAFGNQANWLSHTALRVFYNERFVRLEMRFCCVHYNGNSFDMAKEYETTLRYA
ncbi:hypothetical protein V7P28_23675, partial [Klebsiella michiganensis]